MADIIFRNLKNAKNETNKADYIIFISLKYIPSNHLLKQAIDLLKDIFDKLIKTLCLYLIKQCKVMHNPKDIQDKINLLIYLSEKESTTHKINKSIKKIHNRIQTDHLFVKDRIPPQHNTINKHEFYNHIKITKALFKDLKEFINELEKIILSTG